MRFAGGDFSQRDHEMEDAAWFEPDEARRRMAFANERKLLDLIPDVLATQDAGGS
jgi:NADH pyrophosphatase NudC (nudix superfamily)